MATNITFDEIELGDEIGPSDKIITTEQVFEFVKILETKIEASRFTDTEFAKSVKLGKGRFISKIKRKRPKRHTVNWVNKNKPEGL